MTDGGTAQRVLGLVGDVLGLLDLHEFRPGLLDALQRVVPADFVSLNDIGPTPRDVQVIVRPLVDEGQIETFAALAHENPLVAYYRRTGDGRAFRFSDLVTPAQLHRTELYRRVYAHLGVEYQLAFTLPAAPERLLGVALSRRESDFSDEERALIDHARPFLIQGYRNAIAYTEVATTPLGDGTPSPTDAIARLIERGLTAREAEVIHWVGAGHSSTEAATALSISPRTVQKHVERAYRKLGVRTRAEAAALVGRAPR